MMRTPGIDVFIITMMIDYWLLIIDWQQQEQQVTTWCPQVDCFGEREFRGINREFKEMSPQADLCG